MREELFSRKKKEKKGREALEEWGLRGIVGCLGRGTNYKTARYKEELAATTLCMEPLFHYRSISCFNVK